MFPVSGLDALVVSPRRQGQVGSINPKTPGKAFKKTPDLTFINLMVV